MALKPETIKGNVTLHNRLTAQLATIALIINNYKGIITV